MKPRFVTTREQLEQFITLTDDERAYFEQKERSLPLRVSREWIERIHGANDPLRLQAVPRIYELNIRENELDDPLGDRNHSPCEGLIHHYNDRVLVLVTDKCAMYCRHCFRRHFTSRGKGLTGEQIENILSYLIVHQEVHEIILSGGDSLMAPLRTLSSLFEGFNRIGRPLVKRVGTRLPVVAPGEVRDDYLELLSKQKSLWMVLQINHPDEMSPSFDKLVRKISLLGIPLLNQAVLLKGINDSVEVQKDLCYALIERGIKPYYLFQGDMASGTAHFRVPLDRALAIYEELSRSLSHLALPRFSLDLPGGGGKVNLEQGDLVRQDESYYYFRNEKGDIGRYPRE